MSLMPRDRSLDLAVLRPTCFEGSVPSFQKPVDFPCQPRLLIGPDSDVLRTVTSSMHLVMYAVLESVYSWRLVVELWQATCLNTSQLLELGKHGVSMIEIPGQDEGSIWVGCLLLTDLVVEFIQCLTPAVVVGVWGNVHDHDSRKFPRQVEWPTLHDHELH